METITLNGKQYQEVCKPSKSKPSKSGVVLIRTYSAGVHFGTIKERNGREVTLLNAKRLWSWQGACSLSQVAVDGVDVNNSKISVTVPEITLTEVIEIIPMTKKVAQQMMGAKPWKK